jgi:DNA-binding transcriptional ArsR family regulator
MTTTIRADILGFVARYPAVHVRELERQLELSSKLASYHLAALEEDGFVRRLEADVYVRFVATHTGVRVPESDLALLCILRRAPAFRIVGELLTHEELPQRALVASLGLAKASVSYHLKALLTAEVVTARDEGRERFYRLASPAQARRVMLQFAPVPGELDDFSRMLLSLLRMEGRG